MVLESGFVENSGWFRDSQEAEGETRDSRHREREVDLKAVLNYFDHFLYAPLNVFRIRNQAHIDFLPQDAPCIFILISSMSLDM